MSRGKAKTMSAKRFCKKYSALSVLVVLVSILVTTALLSREFFQREQGRAEILKKHLASFYQFHYKKISQEMYTQRYESVANRVKSIAGHLGSQSYQIQIFNESKALVFQTNQEYGRAITSTSKTLTTSKEILKEDSSFRVDYENRNGQYLLFSHVTIGTESLGFINAKFDDPFELFIGENIGHFMIASVSPAIVFAILLWCAWLWYSKHHFLQPLLKSEAANQKRLAQAEIAVQVGHDIRSPLAMIESIILGQGSIPSEEKIRLRKSHERIQDILIDLKTSSGASNRQREKSAPLTTVISDIVSEKRMQYSNFGDSLEIRFNPNRESYDLFASQCSVDLARILSNLIDNSCEALTGHGVIEVKLSKNGVFAEITVADNGPGIGEDTLHLLDSNEERVPSRKKKGFGLGLAKAKANTEQCGGEFKIASSSRGTTISLKIIRQEPPLWFAAKLVIPNACKEVVVVDDDPQFHQIWSKRIREELGHHNLKVISLSSDAELGEFLEERDDLNDMIFLVDYEFTGQTKSGVDLIKGHKLPSSNTYLVTSHDYDDNVRDLCESRNVKMIPKISCQAVPIEMNKKPPSKITSAVLIDDDPYVRRNWCKEAEMRGHMIHAFEDFEAFSSSGAVSGSKVPIFVDLIARGQRIGFGICKTLSTLGYENIFLCTGADLEAREIDAVPIKGVIGKRPPEWLFSE